MSVLCIDHGMARRNMKLLVAKNIVVSVFMDLLHDAKELLQTLVVCTRLVCLSNSSYFNTTELVNQATIMRDRGRDTDALAIVGF